MPKSERTFGLLIRRRESYGTNYIDATVVSRKKDEYDHPIGCGDFRWEWPKHLQTFELDGLGMHLFASDLRDDHGRARVIGAEIEYREVFSVDERKAARMIRTLKKVHARVHKDSAHEPGDRLVAIAKALKLTFVVEDLSPSFRTSDGARWIWMDVPQGRDRFRALIEEVEREHTARLALTKPLEKAS